MARQHDAAKASRRKTGGLMTKPDTPFPRHWLYYIVLKYGVLAAAVLIALYVVYRLALGAAWLAEDAFFSLRPSRMRAAINVGSSLVPSSFDVPSLLTH